VLGRTHAHTATQIANARSILLLENLWGPGVARGASFIRLLGATPRP
jgi:hypothetical protein